MVKGTGDILMSDVRWMMEEALSIISHRNLYHYIVTNGGTSPDDRGQVTVLMVQRTIG